MMNERTKNTYLTACAAFGSNEFSMDQYENLFKNADHVKLDTLRRNKLVRVNTHTTRYFYTVAEIVQELNECSGADCWCGSWYYQIDDQGRIYQDIESTAYQMVEGE